MAYSIEDRRKLEYIVLTTCENINLCPENIETRRFRRERLHDQQFQNLFYFNWCFMVEKYSSNNALDSMRLTGMKKAVHFAKNGSTEILSQ